MQQVRDTDPVKAGHEVSRKHPLLSVAEWLRNWPGFCKLVRWARESRTRLIDSRLGVETSSWGYRDKKLRTRHDDACGYVATDYSLLRRVISRASITREDVVYDLGCGKGRAVCVLGRMRLKKVIGVEFDESLARIARSNVAALRKRRSPIEIAHADAATLDYSDGSVFFLFHPFGEDTLSSVLESIHRSLERFPRTIRVIYVNPLCAHVIQQCSWLHHCETYRPLLFQMSACYWSSPGPV